MRRTEAPERRERENEGRSERGREGERERGRENGDERMVGMRGWLFGRDRRGEGRKKEPRC